MRPSSLGRVASGSLSASEAVGRALERIERLDPHLRAFCTLCEAEARREAVALDERLRRGEKVGPLAGVPVAVKDLLSTRGTRTTFGSELYADYIPDRDDVAVERLRQAGAIVIGKTNTSEFGYGAVAVNRLFPPTRNPWNRLLTPGGSSAGSAAAVAAGLAPLALGSDGGGSIRVPAALTGIVGFKPSFGRVPVFPGCRDETMPGASGWESLEHIGPMTRTVGDAALAFAVLAGPSQFDWRSIAREEADWTDLAWRDRPELRVAYSDDLEFANVDQEVCAIVGDSVANLARALGAQLDEAAPAVGDVQRTFEALVGLDTDRAGLRRLASERGVSFGQGLDAVLAEPWTADAFTAAILDRKRIANVMSRFMASHDFLITPSVAVAAFPLSDSAPIRINGRPAAPSAWAPFSALANLTGLPAISVPAGLTRDGRPVGLQIIGRHLDDLGVLRLAAFFESIQPWRNAYKLVERQESADAGPPARSQVLSRPTEDAMIRDSR